MGVELVIGVGLVVGVELVMGEGFVPVAEWFGSNARRVEKRKAAKVRSTDASEPISDAVYVLFFLAVWLWL